MKRLGMSVFAAAVGLFLLAAPAVAQSAGEAPPDTTRAPLRPFDPPEPEPVFIPDLVSNLVVTDLGEALEVSPLAAIPPVEVPGSGPTFDVSSWMTFAAPALIPLLGALILLVFTRIPQRAAEASPADTAG